MKKHYLMTPGPAPVPEEILKVMSEPIIHHRTSQYRNIVQKINQDIKQIFKTKNNVLTFASSGTGAMEASVTGTLSKGDTAIVVRGGNSENVSEKYARLTGSKRFFWISSGALDLITPPSKKPSRNIPRLKRF